MLNILELTLCQTIVKQLSIKTYNIQLCSPSLAGRLSLSVCWNQWSWAWFICCCDTWESRLIPRSLLRFVLALGLVYCSLDAPFTTAEAATSLSGYLPLGNSSKTQTKINPNPETPPAKPEFLRPSPFYVSIKERLLLSLLLALLS